MAIGYIYPNFKINKMRFFIFSFFIFSFFIGKTNFRNDSTELAPVTENENNLREFVEIPTWGNQFINIQSARILPHKTWGFKVQHRFGTVSADSSVVQDFLGLDLPTTMRLAFSFNLHKKLYVEIGRTNQSKTIDIEGKYLLLQQTTDYKIPVSVALYFNTSIRTAKFPSVASNAVFKADSTPFFYKPAHRLAYVSQLIISSQLFERLTLQVSPMFIYHNLASAFHKNMTYVIGTALRFKVATRTALMFEYANKLNNHCFCFIHPLSFGVEFGTEGHVFQLFVSNASSINPSQVFTISGHDMTKGKFLIGFNLSRSFNYKKK